MLSQRFVNKGVQAYEGSSPLLRSKLKGDSWVVVLDEVDSSCNQVFDASETTYANGPLGDESEPAFNLIEPGRGVGNVVNLEARPLCQPESYFCMLVGGVVVDDQMNILRHSLIDALEELQKFLMTMTRLALCQHGTGGDVEGGKQRGGAMARSRGSLLRRIQVP